MRNIKLLPLLVYALLLAAPMSAAQRPRAPEAIRRAGGPAAPGRPARPTREQKRENTKRTEAARSGVSRPVEARPAERARPTEKTSRPGRGQTAGRPTERTRLLDHVFRGGVRKRQASGFHHEGAGMEAAYGTKVIEGTRTPPDAHGVYRARVQVRGVTKAKESSFFPRAWSRGDVVKAINEARSNAGRVERRAPNYLEGVSSGGVRIGMYTNKNGEVVTAFPIYQGKQ